jgi:hypothetical protein
MNCRNTIIFEDAEDLFDLIAPAVHQATTLPPKEARRILTLFKQWLPKDLTAMG